jgi:hypothetical protein
MLLFYTVLYCLDKSCTFLLQWNTGEQAEGAGQKAEISTSLKNKELRTWPGLICGPRAGGFDVHVSGWGCPAASGRREWKNVLMSNLTGHISLRADRYWRPRMLKVAEQWCVGHRSSAWDEWKIYLMSTVHPWTICQKLEEPTAFLGNGQEIYDVSHILKYLRQPRSCLHFYLQFWHQHRTYWLLVDFTWLDFLCVKLLVFYIA